MNATHAIFHRAFAAQVATLPEAERQQWHLCARLLRLSQEAATLATPHYWYMVTDLFYDVLPAPDTAAHRSLRAALVFMVGGNTLAGFRALRSLSREEVEA